MTSTFTSQKNCHVVPIGNMEILDKPDIELSVYALGPSGLVILYDDTIPAGGLLHYMLPDSSLSPERAINQPNLFADTGIQPLVESFIQRFGSKKENIKVFLAGGSNAQTENDSLKIGEKNIEQAKSFLEQAGLKVTVEETGGLNNRSLRFNTASGIIKVKINSEFKEYQLK